LPHSSSSSRFTADNRASGLLQLLQPQVLAAFATALVVSGILSLLAALFVRYFRLTRKGCHADLRRSVYFVP
jgi:hypothetical protein